MERFYEVSIQRFTGRSLGFSPRISRLFLWEVIGLGLPSLRVSGLLLWEVNLVPIGRGPGFLSRVSGLLLWKVEVLDLSLPSRVIIWITFMGGRPAVIEVILGIGIEVLEWRELEVKGASSN
jgi:hypothetical protein